MPYDSGEIPREPTDAPGVEYRTSEHAPALRIFDCKVFRAALTQRTCAARWEKAQDARGDEAYRLAGCRACGVGAAHAGRGALHYPALYRAPLCARCGAGGRRMIGNRVCVSCANRAYELRKGKNARGNVPVELLQRPLHTVEILVEVDSHVDGERVVEVRRLRDRETSSLLETMVQCLRTSTGRIAFGFAGRVVRADEISAVGETIEAPPAHRMPAAVLRYRGPLFASSALYLAQRP